MNGDQHRPDSQSGQTGGQATLSAVQPLFSDAVRHHQGGHLTDAERLYRQVLTVDPRHADSLHLLGVIGGQTGRHDLAADMIGRAIAIKPNEASYHCNLGISLKQLAQLDDAVACFRNALELKPDYAEAHNNLGIALKEQARLDDAIDCYHRAIELRPNYAGAHNNLGIAFKEQGRLDEAIGCYRRAIELDSNYAGAHSNLGIALKEQGRLDAAATCFRRAIELNPNHALAHNNLGIVLKQQARLHEAVVCFRRALDLRPDSPEAHNNLGTVLGEQARQGEAVACYRKAIELRPDFAEAHNNLGTACRALQRLDEAVASYHRAIDLVPDYADARNNLAMALLARGDLAAGWEEYECRWKTPHALDKRRGFAQPQWRGEPALGRTLLIHAEQGLGDTLQFCRYAPLAAARGLRVILEVPKVLVRLLCRLPGIELVVERGEALPQFDLHCPMLSLPLALETTRLAAIPGAVPYLHADATQAAAWRTRLDTMGKPGPRVGLAWAGSSRRHSATGAALDGRRSIAPGLLAPLFELSGPHFVSLQKDGAAPLEHFQLTDLMGEVADFADTAALITNLDLVISVDTSVAHLAAALGKPVWLLDRFDPCWRWLVGRRDSPWYPTLRIYRQPHPGDWDAVLAEVAGDLRSLVTDRARALPESPE